MTITTDSSSALLRAGSPSPDDNQRRFARRPDNSSQPDQDTVTLSPSILSLAIKSNSAERVAALKLQYESGTYQPSSQELAGRILDVHF